jgi:hypothetical protein
MFGNINGSWLDGAFFNTLKYVDGMHLFFMSQVRTIAMICFALSFGISCVKMLMGAMELNKVLTQAFISIVTYFIMIFLFPHIMIMTQKIVSELAYGAVFTQDLDTKFDAQYGTEADYFAYLNEIGTDKNGNTLWEVSENKYGRKVLSLHITHKETGIISLNKVFQMIIVTFKAMWKSLDISGIVDFFKHIPDFLMVIAIGLSYLWSFSVALVNYTMVVVEYAFLYGMGALSIPFMLWEGTKHAFTTLCGSIHKIAVKLLVVQISLYLAVMANMDILKNMFIISGGKVGFMQSMEFYLSVAFMVIFIKLFVDKASDIADFLCGGQPSLGFGDFARAAASAAAAGMAAKGVGNFVKNGVANTKAKLARLGAGRSGSKTKGPGGQSTPGSSSFNKSVGQSAKQGGANNMEKRIGASANTPQSARNPGRSVQYGKNSSGSPANVSAGRGQTKGERPTNSKNVSDRVQGMGEQYREKGNKALKSSIQA